MNDDTQIIALSGARSFNPLERRTLTLSREIARFVQGRLGNQQRQGLMADFMDAVKNAAKKAGSALEAMANSHVCTQCGYVGRPTSQSSFSGCFFIVLLICFVVPGILYAIYTMTHTKQVCPRCKAPNTMIPIDSPKAKAFRQGRAAIPLGQSFCPHCGQAVAAGKYCPNCGRELDVSQGQK